MSEIQFKDFVTEGLDKLPSQWDDKAVVIGFLTSILEVLQPVEDGLQQLNDERSIDTAIGAQLDVIGDIVGIQRQGRNDTEYRQAIKVQVAVNNSDGTEGKISAALAILQPASTFALREQYPAGVNLVIDNVEVTDINALIAILDNIVSATILPSVDAEFELIYDTGDTLEVSQSATDNFSAVIRTTSS